jgi:hypothetical protein
MAVRYTCSIHLYMYTCQVCSYVCSRLYKGLGCFLCTKFRVNAYCQFPCLNSERAQGVKMKFGIEVIS